MASTLLDAPPVQRMQDEDRRDGATAGLALDLPVAQMSCAACAGRVRRALAAVDGVVSAAVNLAAGKVSLELSRPVPAETLVGAVEAAGYAVPTEILTLDIEGMSCASCVRRVQRALVAVPGVLDAWANLATGTAEVRRVASSGPAAPLLAAVRAAGYVARPREAESDRLAARRNAERREERSLARDLWVAVILTLPIVVSEMGGHLWPAFGGWLDGVIGVTVRQDLIFLLATIVQFGPGWRFYRQGVPALLHLAPDMNSLVAIGTTAAWAYSAMTVFFPALMPSGTAHVYFEAGAVVVTLILLGRSLEVRARHRTGAAIERLLDLQATSAHVRRDGSFRTVALDEIALGDVFRVRPGERLALDGVVVEGHSYVDESMVSGEPMPVARTVGDPVVGGTINRSGSLDVEVTRVGSDTLLAQIIALVERAQGARLPIQNVVDRVTSWFVPAVLAASLLTFIAWLILGGVASLPLAVANAVAVLIIACPCAMGLATPASIIVGGGRAAQLGILFRAREALQTLRDAELVVFDKTGTLTEGRPALTARIFADGVDAAWIMRAAAAVEARSEHPIAAAIVGAVPAAGRLEMRAFSAIPGAGVKAVVEGRSVLIGTARLLRQEGVDVGVLEDRLRHQQSQPTATPVFLAVDGQPAAALLVEDPLKTTSRTTVAALRGSGRRVALVTGDVPATAHAVAADLGIDEVVAEVPPAGKVEALARLRAGHRKLAFVGDGINDAPALASADIGIALGTGADVAIESADVVLMSGDPAGVWRAIALSHAVMRNIQQNLFWAFGYNVLLIPLAAGVLYPVWGFLLSPIVAGAAMAFSSVFVLGNALRLRRLAPQGSAS